MNKEVIIMCDECMYTGLITDKDGKTWLQDSDQINHPHEHTGNLIYLTPK